MNISLSVNIIWLHWRVGTEDKMVLPILKLHEGKIKSWKLGVNHFLIRAMCHVVGVRKKKLLAKSLLNIWQRNWNQHDNNDGIAWPFGSITCHFYCHLRPQIWDGDFTGGGRLGDEAHHGDRGHWAVLWILYAGLWFLGNSHRLQLCSCGSVGPTDPV